VNRVVDAGFAVKLFIDALLPQSAINKASRANVQKAKEVLAAARTAQDKNATDIQEKQLNIALVQAETAKAEAARDLVNAEGGTEDPGAPLTDTSADIKFFNLLGAGFPRGKCECGVCDKGYIGGRRLICPKKLKKTGLISVTEANFNKFIQLARQGNERLFARLHRWKIMRFNPFSHAKNIDCITESILKLECKYFRVSWEAYTFRFVTLRSTEVNWDNELDLKTLREKYIQNVDARRETVQLNLTCHAPMTKMLPFMATIVTRAQARTALHPKTRSPVTVLTTTVSRPARFHRCITALRAGFCTFRFRRAPAVSLSY